MRPSNCPTCYRAAERSGELVHQLQKAASRLHVALGHTSRDFSHCDLPACLENVAVLKGQARPRPPAEH